MSSCSDYQGQSTKEDMVDSRATCGPNDLGECHIVGTLAALGSWGSSRAAMSPATFQQLAPLSIGQITIE